MKKKICILIGVLLIFVVVAICLLNGMFLNEYEENQEEIQNIGTFEGQTLEISEERSEDENEEIENQESEVENESENVEIQNKEEIVEENTSTQTADNKEKSTNVITNNSKKNTKVDTSNNEKSKVEKNTEDKKTENKKTEDKSTYNKNTQEVLNKSNTSTSTKNVETNGTENKQATEKKIDLSKYFYYEKAKDGTYRAFIIDKTEINNLKGLIDNAINKFGYKNINVIEDSSLFNDKTIDYFTANKTNVQNAVYESEGFNIYYYAVKEYFISSNGTESYFQTRSYIKVK